MDADNFYSGCLTFLACVYLGSIMLNLLISLYVIHKANHPIRQKAAQAAKQVAKASVAASAGAGLTIAATHVPGEPSPLSWAFHSTFGRGFDYDSARLKIEGDIVTGHVGKERMAEAVAKHAPDGIVDRDAMEEIKLDFKERLEQTINPADRALLGFPVPLSSVLSGTPSMNRSRPTTGETTVSTTIETAEEGPSMSIESVLKHAVDKILTTEIVAPNKGDSVTSDDDDDVVITPPRDTDTDTSMIAPPQDIYDVDDATIATTDSNLSPAVGVGIADADDNSSIPSHIEIDISSMIAPPRDLDDASISTAGSQDIAVDDDNESVS